MVKGSVSGFTVCEGLVSDPYTVYVSSTPVQCV